MLLHNLDSSSNQHKHFCLILFSFSTLFKVRTTLFFHINPAFLFVTNTNAPILHYWCTALSPDPSGLLRRKKCFQKKRHKAFFIFTFAKIAFIDGCFFGKVGWFWMGGGHPLPQTTPLLVNDHIQSALSLVFKSRLKVVPQLWKLLTAFSWLCPLITQLNQIWRFQSCPSSSS